MVLNSKEKEKKRSVKKALLSNNTLFIINVAIRNENNNKTSVYKKLGYEYCSIDETATFIFRPIDYFTPSTTSLTSIWLYYH